MEQELFLKAKDLEARIFRLKLIRDYLKSLLSGVMVETKIEISFMGRTQCSPDNLQKHHPYAIASGTTNESDMEALFESIENQIKKLEEEFNSL